MTDKLKETVESRMARYVDDQVVRVLEFKEAYEAKHDTKLGDYPFATNFDKPVKERRHTTVLKPTQFYMEMNMNSLIKDAANSRILDLDDFKRAKDTDDREYETEEYFASVVSDSPPKKASRQLKVRNYMHDMLDALDGRDNATLEHIKQLDSKGVTLTPSADEAKYFEYMRNIERARLADIKAQAIEVTLAHSVENAAETVPIVESSHNPREMDSFAHEFFKSQVRKQQVGTAKSPATRTPSKGLNMD